MERIFVRNEQLYEFYEFNNKVFPNFRPQIKMSHTSRNMIVKSIPLVN